jgi:hypothetical protein
VLFAFAIISVEFMRMRPAEDCDLNAELTQRARLRRHIVPEPVERDDNAERPVHFAVRCHAEAFPRATRTPNAVKERSSRSDVAANSASSAT